VKPDENTVKDFFEEKGLRVERFDDTEMTQKTPDFKVYLDDRLVFYCEVKSIFEDGVEGAREDPTYNKIQNKVHEAVKQFNSINLDKEYLNVLALVNHEFGTDEVDLISILTGNFYSESGEKYPLFKKYSEGRIKDGKKIIDLYLWFERVDKQYVRFLYKDLENETIKKLKEILEGKAKN